MQYKTLFTRGFQDGTQKGVEYATTAAIVAVVVLVGTAIVWGVKTIAKPKPIVATNETKGTL